MAGTDSQAMLDALNAAITAFLSAGGVREYTMPNGQSVKRESLADLMAMRDRLTAEVKSVTGPAFRPVVFGRPRG